MPRSRVLAVLTLLILPTTSSSTEPLIVRNSNKPLWDSSHRIDFTENLRIGGEEDDSVIFGRILDLASDSKGRIIVSDYTAHTVQRFSAEGELLGAIGRAGEGPGEYRAPTAVATDSKDNIYVAGSGRVSTFDASGAFLREFRDDSYGFPRDIRVLPDGGVVLAEDDHYTKTVLQKYVDGKHVMHAGEAHKWPHDVARSLAGYLGGYIDVSRDGTIYYSQLVPYEIRTYTPDGVLTMRVFRENDFIQPPKVELSGDTSTISGGCISTSILALPDGKFVNVVPLPPDWHTLFDVFDKDGRLLLSHRHNRPFTPEWHDANGDVYALDSEAGAVVRARMTIR